MKSTLKFLIASTAAVTLHPALGQSTAILYGRLTTALEHASGGERRVSRLSNYRSVLGLRGEEDLGGGLRAVWQLEGAVALDTGGGWLSNRDTRVGLAGPWGTAFLGAWTLPYTGATSAFDPFYPTTAGYMSIMGNGSAAIADHLSNTSAFDRRQSNQIQYWSPTVAGFKLSLAYGLNEGIVTKSGGRPWLTSGSLTYESGGLLIATAAEYHHAYQAKDTSDRAVKFGVAYRVGAARVSAVAEHLRYGTATGKLARTAWYVSATYRTGRGVIKAAYGRASDGRGGATETVGAVRSGRATGAAQFSLGYDYELSSRTTLFALASRFENRRDATYDFAINDVGATRGSHVRLIALGMKHTF